MSSLKLRMPGFAWGCGMAKGGEMGTEGGSSVTRHSLHSREDAHRGVFSSDDVLF